MWRNSAVKVRGFCRVIGGFLSRTSMIAYMSIRSGPHQLALLDDQLSLLARQAEEGTLSNVTLKRGILHVTPDESTLPADLDHVLAPIYERVPPVNITDLLAEVDQWIQMRQHFQHLHSAHEGADARVVYAAILGDGLNLGLRKMAQSCPGMTYERLQWFADWFLRAETYANATSAIVNLQHQLPLAHLWGDGTTASSDGVDFPTAWGGRRTGRVNAHYGSDPAAMFYGFVSDQYAPFWMRPIPITHRQAPYAVEGLLSHRTRLQITEHSTDTTGYTDHIFATFHLLGWRFAPRIRDISQQRLYTPGTTNTYEPIGPMLGNPIDSALIREAWPELCRLARTLRAGQTPPVIVLRKLAAYPRQHTLARALREMGRIERTLYAVEWFQQPPVRRRVAHILNKGEGKNNLEQAVFAHRQGKVHDRSIDDQIERASGLNLVLAAIVLWNTVYLGAAVDAARAAGHPIPDAYLAHLSPLGWEHINLTGDFVWRQRRPLILPPLVRDSPTAP
ncbi:tn3 family transposase ISPa40 [Herpetosiphon gulosus]|uniref:Tn3 family transposase ISPa40 n=2 Tax=Herpetosiphon gulosus TaxID=1973496 RepID=A0ABP9XAD3_9CHLR